MKGSQPVAYSDTIHGVIDLMHPVNGSDELVSHYQKETIEQLRERHPDAEVISIDHAIAKSEAHFRQPVSEITEKSFWYYLEVLFPEDWQHHNGGESFKLCEYTSGSITQIFAHIGNRYFTLHDNHTMPHIEILRRVREFIGAQQ